MAELTPLPVLAAVHEVLDGPLARDRDRSQQLAIAVDVAYAAGVADGRRQATEERTEEPGAEVWPTCAHCGVKIRFVGGGRWRHRDGLSACDNGRTNATPGSDHG